MHRKIYELYILLFYVILGIKQPVCERKDEHKEDSTCTDSAKTPDCLGDNF